jgi:hypothetical protein
MTKFCVDRNPGIAYIRASIFRNDRNQKINTVAFRLCFADRVQA